jgi:Zn-dependent protease with chaperone function
VRHRHIAWFAAAAGVLMLLAIGPLSDLERGLRASVGATLGGGLAVAVTLGGAILGIGWLSRRFERQADVFAARQLQRRADGRDTIAGEGATDFVAALKSVCRVNGMPLTPFRWHKARPFTSFLAWLGHIAQTYFHGSMPNRMAAILHLGGDPQRTAAFDARMLRLRLGLVTVGVLAGAWAVWG